MQNCKFNCRAYLSIHDQFPGKQGVIPTNSSPILSHYNYQDVPCNWFSTWKITRKTINRLNVFIVRFSFPIESRRSWWRFCWHRQIRQWIDRQAVIKNRLYGINTLNSFMDNRATTTKRIGQFRLNFLRRKELNSDDPVFPAFDEGTPIPSFLCATRNSLSLQ